MKNYRRVIPRDLFNEAKLLRGLGKISLMIHDNTLTGLNVNHENERTGFVINQEDSDGSINVVNLQFFDNNGTPVYFFHGLNCKERESLQMQYKGQTYWCFNDAGEWMPDSQIFVKGAKC